MERPSQYHYPLVLSALIVLLVVTSCQPAQNQPNPVTIIQTESPGWTPESHSDENDTPPEATTSPEALDEGIMEETDESDTEESLSIIQPTPAPTLSDWRDAPITPEEISERVFEIYEMGQRLGRNPHSFSVIGDCQSIPFVFMGPYGRGELQPDAAESQLWKAINTFDPSFKRWAVTARGGFTAASILNPIQADPDLCKPGETPLSCEYRLNNPAFALVTLETWLEPTTVDRYEIYLRQILDLLIERGTVPILLTKADASELRGKEHIINPAIVNLAYEYQVPVVNFWRAAQYLDNAGIDPEREGFHLSEAGYKIKNTLALRALYQVWTAVEGLEIAEAEPTPTATPEPTPKPAVQMTLPNCDEGCIFFGMAESQDGDVAPSGVWAFAPGTGALTRVLPQGFDLQDVSQDGRRLLANQADRLYVIDLQEESYELISETFNNDGRQGAYWGNNETEIISLDRETPLLTENGAGFNLFPNRKAGWIYFESGQCESKDYCESEGVYRLGDDGEPERLNSYKDPVFSPDGKRMAFLNPEAATADNFYNIHYMLMEDVEPGIASRRVLYFPDVSGFMVYANVKGYRFSPDGDKIFILYDVYSEYYEHSLRLETYLWDLETGIQYDFGELEGVSGSLLPRMAWSPEGDQVLFFLTNLTEEGEYQIDIYQTDLLTGERLSLFADNLLTDTDYIYLTNLHWRE